MEKIEKIGIHNRFEIEVVDAKTGVVKQRARGFNKILNQLYTRLCSDVRDGGQYFNYVFYGSGTGTPSASDTSLFTHEGTINVTGGENENPMPEVDYENRVAYLTKKAQLDENTAVGVELSEVGIGYNSNENNLCTHAMLEDMNGNPITILKTNTDVINIYATVYLHWGSSAIFTPYFEKEYSPTFGWIPVTAFPWWFGLTWNQRPINENTDCGYNKCETGGLEYNTSTTPTKDAENKRVSFTFARLAVGNGNMSGGISEVVLKYNNRRPSYSIPVDHFYSGDNITNEAIGTGDGETTGFTTKFDFPSNADVYVNGTKQTSGVTVKNIPVSTYYLSDYIRDLYRGSRVSSHQTKFVSGARPTSNTSWTIGGGCMFYNAAYEVGFASISNPNGGVIYGSNDLENWTQLAAASSGNVTLTGANQHFKYYKNDGNAGAIMNFNSCDRKSIVFDTAPANGAVITANYHTPYIAKDADHVFDFTLTVQFGEYQE